VSFYDLDGLFAADRIGQPPTELENFFHRPECAVIDWHIRFKSVG